jgi:hypothetical protein
MSETTSTITTEDGKRALRLVEFNLHLARYAHRSWYENALADPKFAFWLGEESGHRAEELEPQVSQWLLHELGLQSQMDWNLDRPQKRVWLLDRQALEQLALELALAMHREWLVKIIDSNRVRALSAKVGAGLVRFVVEDLPEGCLHYQSLAVNLDGDLARLDEELKEQGIRTLVALLEPGWHAVRARASLFFDRALGLDSVPPLQPPLVRRALDLICGHLLPRRFPEWAWCF